MGLWDAFRLCWRMLRLDEAAMREVAENRWCVLYGLVWSAIAGLARHYAQSDWKLWLWLGPCLSVAVALGGSFLFYVSGDVIGTKIAYETDVDLRAPDPGYVGFLAVFSFTAPLGWLNGLPVELVSAPDGAHTVRFLLVTVVSVWRVAVLFEAYRVLLGLPVWRRVLCFLVPLGVLFGLFAGLGYVATVASVMFEATLLQDQTRELEAFSTTFYILCVVVPVVLIWRSIARQLRECGGGPEQEDAPQ